jgi:hypothetical protein
VQVAIERRSATVGSYVATAGRLTVEHATGDRVSGTVFASLRQAGGTKRASLNGTWSCRIVPG